MSAASVTTLAASIAAVDAASSDELASTSAPVPSESDDPMRDQRRTARIAGALYLALFVLGPFVDFYVPGQHN